MSLKCSARSFEMLLGNFKICILSGINSFKNMEIHSFRGPFPHFPVHSLESVEKAAFQICSGASNLNEEHWSIILETKISLNDSDPSLCRIFTEC